MTNLSRKIIDLSYDVVNPLLFRLTQQDPEVAHEYFIELAQKCDELGMSPLLGFDKRQTPIISNAAGFNKNGDIPLRFLKYFGFDRVVVGTVTNDEWNGNEKPRIARFQQSESIVNWLGLPGIGSSGVAENLEKYSQESQVPLTINLMSTPGKVGDERLEDLVRTIEDTKKVSTVNRYELNVSCPNTHSSEGDIDQRDEVLRGIEQMIKTCKESIGNRELFVKVQPDLEKSRIGELVSLFSRYGVAGVTGVNTTTEHDSLYIPTSPGQGGASGLALREKSNQALQDWMEKIGNRDMQYISVGGINSKEEAQRRVAAGAQEVQLYSALIFNGSRLVRDIKS